MKLTESQATVFVILLVLFGLAAVLKVVARQWAIRRRMAAGRRTIADRELVTLTGVVKARGDVLTAPLSGHECVAHRSVARTCVGEARSGRAPRIKDTLSREGMVPFVLATPDGDVLVDGTKAELAVRPRPLIPRDLAREGKFLRSFSDETHPRNAYFEETAIEIGAKIAVHGIALVEATPAPSGEQPYREAATHVRVVGDQQHPLLIAEAGRRSAAR